jgi:hypothetical protein
MINPETQSGSLVNEKSIDTNHIINNKKRNYNKGILIFLKESRQ